MSILRNTGTLVLFSSLVALFGCEAEKGERSPFVHHDTVFNAMAGGDKAVSPVEGNHSVGKDGQPEEYHGIMALQQGAIQIRYELVGITFCAASDDGKEWDYADVYVISITGEGTKTETIPIVYKGGTMTVIDRPDLQVFVSQRGSS